MKLRSLCTLGVVLLAIGAIACDTGSVDGPQRVPDADVVELVECTAEFSITGTLNPPVAPDPDAGCVPNGIWTVNLTQTDPGNCDMPFDWEPTYTYEVTGDNDMGFTYTYSDDPLNEDVFLKVTAAGGTCLGSFEHYSNDTKDLMLVKPAEDDLILTGTAYFERQIAPQI